MSEKSEIIAGLKNAVERGYSLESAIQSFINSGYNRQDVLDSAKNINEAVISKIPYKPEQQIHPPKQFTQHSPHLPPMPEQKPQILTASPPPKRKKWLIILLAIILIILLAVLFGFLFFKEEIIELLEKLGYSV